MRFTDPLAFPPRKQPPKTSWWAKPQTREEFSQTAKAEESRIVGHAQFGGRKRVIDKFPRSAK